MGFRGSRVQIPPSRLKRRAERLAVFRWAGGLLPPPLACGSRHSRSNPAVPTGRRISPATNFVVGLFLHLRPPCTCASGQRNRARPTASSRVLCATDTRLRVASSYQNGTFESGGWPP